MHFITIGFKNKRTLTFHCESFTVEESTVTNEIIGIKWQGIQELSVLFIDLSEIIYIVQHQPKEEKSGEKIYEWPGEESTKPSIGFK